MQQFLVVLLLLATSLVTAQGVEVTFQVDMNGQTVSPDGVHVAGDLNGWSPDATPLADMGNGIYSATVVLQTGTDIQFKFLNGNAWGTEEVPPLSCAVNGNNRIFTAPFDDAVLTPVPFGSCPADAATKMVTFQVDMNGQTVSANGVHVAGNFQGWSPGSTQMTDNGSGIYQVTVPVLNSISVIQYKFLNGNDWGTDEDPPAGCENLDNNRAVVATSTADLVLPVQTFAGCEDPIPTKEVTFLVEMTGFDISANGVHLAGNFQGWNPGGTPMTDIGNGFYEVTVSIPVAVSAIQYKFVNGNDWGFEETPPQDCAINNNRFAALPLSPDPIRLPGVMFGTCELAVAVSELVVGNQFTLSPSVSSDRVMVNWELSRAEAVTLSVFNLNGQLMTSEKFPSSELTSNRLLEVGNWAPGMYLVYLRSNRAHSVRKLIVQ